MRIREKKTELRKTRETERVESWKKTCFFSPLEFPQHKIARGPLGMSIDMWSTYQLVSLSKFQLHQLPSRIAGA